jgi:hypothetical protein
VVLALLLDCLGILNGRFDLTNGISVVVSLDILFDGLAFQVEGGSSSDAFLIFFWEMVVDVLLKILDSDVSTNLVLIFDISYKLLDVVEGLKVVVLLYVMCSGFDHSD